jgi:ketosteroid isomerase-like protein
MRRATSPGGGAATTSTTPYSPVELPATSGRLGRCVVLTSNEREASEAAGRRTTFAPEYLEPKHVSLSSARFRDTGVVSQETVEIVRALQPQGDMVGMFRDDEVAAAATAAAAPLFEPDFEVLFVRSDIERATYRGFEGLRSAFVDWLEPWDSYRAEIEELVDLGDRVAVLTRDYGRRRGMEREIDFKGMSVYVFRGDKISRIEFHFDREEGIAAVGLGDRSS